MPLISWWSVYRLILALKLGSFGILIAIMEYLRTNFKIYNGLKNKSMPSYAYLDSNSINIPLLSITFL